ncbi:PAS domain-containing protein [Massilia sp. PWRC2]|uniref:PAS domain-containing protein n=1 Tax=Massilia sp. PWRC2 TaxID=2804626 RepID=UPI003CED46C8
MIAFDQLPCAILHTDHSGRILQMNQELLHILGSASGSAPPAAVEQMLPPASRIFLQTHLWPMLMRDGQVREIYLHLRTHAGERLPVMVNIGRSVLAGAPCYAWALFVAHERSRFEAELIKSRNRSEASAELAEVQQRFAQRVADASGQAIAFFDLAARCRFASSRFAVLAGRSLASLQNCAWHEVFDAATCAQHRHSLEAALRGENGSVPAPLVSSDVISDVSGSASAWHVAYLSSRDSAGIVDGCFMVEQGAAPPC